jgi:hypothetical protein
MILTTMEKRMDEMDKLWGLLVSDLDCMFKPTCKCDSLACNCHDINEIVEDLKIREFEDGSFGFDVAGFDADDLGVTVDADDVMKFRFFNGVQELDFDIKLPKKVDGVNLSFDKGIMTMTITYKPSDISINFV